MGWDGMGGYGAAWDGMGWGGVGWHGVVVWFGMLWSGMGWHGTEWDGAVRGGMGWHGMESPDRLGQPSEYGEGAVGPTLLAGSVCGVRVCDMEWGGAGCA